MGSFSVWHWLIVLIIVLVLFGGAGKIPALMGDMAKGVKAFKHGLKDEEQVAEPLASKSYAIEGDATSAADGAAAKY